MAIPHAKPGEVVDVRPLGSAFPATVTTTLIKTPHVEVIRIVMPTGKEISEHVVPSEIIVQCLEGRIAFTASGKTVDLEAGQLLYLEGGQPHTARSIDDASFLLTILNNR